MNEIVIKKFWNNIEKTNNCWNWKGFLDKSGLPIIRATKEYSSRRVSLFIENKFPAKGEQVLVTCNNKLCVNPEHLVYGDEARFWNKVFKLSEQQGGCWIWIGAHDKNGYGKFHLSNDGLDIHLRAHVYSFMIYNRVPRFKILQVCHTCDNPACVRPEHLFLGTAQENTDDKVSKNKQAKGELHGISKLTEAQVKEIRELYPKINGMKLAKLYNVTHSVIYSILNRKYWKHI